MLDSPRSVVAALLTYTDWWYPSSSSVVQVGAARRSSGFNDGFRPGLLETLDERTELRRRMRAVNDRERQVLFLWYVKQLEVREIARAVHVSRRQCFRLRAAAIRRIVDAGDDGSSGRVEDLIRDPDEAA